MLKNILVPVILLSLLSCSKLSRTEGPFKSKELNATEQQAVEREVEQIHGSSKLADHGKHDKKTYFLYGAEHLGLENYYFDIPVVYNAKVKKWMKYFLNRGRDFFERYSARAGRYAPILGSILEQNGLPRDLIFLAMAESGFNSKAKSWAKAVGPWQFMPYTGKRFGLKINWYVDERRDPIKATVAASLYLKKLYERFGSWELAAAGYNAGEGKVNRAIRRYKTENFWRISKGRYLKSETKNYVPKIMAMAIIGKNLTSFGFEDIDFHEPLNFEEIEIPPMTDLLQVADAIGVEFSEIHRLNPEIMRWFTPPGDETYHLRIPVEAKSKWESCCKERAFPATEFQKYSVRSHKGANWNALRRKFKIKPHVLKFFNPQIAKKNWLKKGTEIVLPFREGQTRREEMYADLYEKPRKSVIRKRQYRKWLKWAKRKGKKISNPSRYYTVKKGDTLWTVAKKNGISLDTLILSNYKLVKNRMIRAGDRLVVR